MCLSKISTARIIKACQNSSLSGRKIFHRTIVNLQGIKGRTILSRTPENSLVEPFPSVTRYFATRAFVGDEYFIDTLEKGFGKSD